VIVVLTIASLYVAQKEVYDNSRVKKPCNAYMMFMKDFLRKRANEYSSAREAVSAGRLPLVSG